MIDEKKLIEKEIYCSVCYRKILCVFRETMEQKAYLFQYVRCVFNDEIIKELKNEQG
jgi:hypothetical protein